MSLLRCEVGFFKFGPLGSVKDTIDIDLTSLNLSSTLYTGKDLYLEFVLSVNLFGLKHLLKSP